MSGKRTTLFGLFGERVYPVVFMVVLTAICITGISGLHLYTRDRVALNNSLFLKRSVLYAAGIGVQEGAGGEGSGADAVSVDALYNERIREVFHGVEDGTETVRYYEVMDQTLRVTGYVVPWSGPGLWGEIEVVIGFGSDLETVTGIDFTKQNETPGLGARITELWFREQFRGKRGPFVMVDEGTRSPDPHTVDAITGATRTSTGVLSIVNGAAGAAEAVITGAVSGEVE